MRPQPPRFLRAPPTPAAARRCPAGGAGKQAPQRTVAGAAPLPARLLRRPAAAAASPARSPCAPAGSAAAAHRLPTREPGARRLSMPSAPAALAAVCESQEARRESAAAPAWGLRPGRGTQRPRPLRARRCPGSVRRGRLPRLRRVGLNTGIRRGRPTGTPSMATAVFKGSEGSGGLTGVPRDMKKGPRAS